MPTVKDATGEVVAKLPYDAKGEAQAEAMVKQDPSLKVDYAPGGQYDAPSMREQMYAGGGKTGYSEIGMYKKGGKVGKRPHPLNDPEQNPGYGETNLEGTEEGWNTLYEYIHKPSEADEKKRSKKKKK